LGGWWSQFLCHAPAGMWWHPYCSCCKWKWLYLDKLFQHTPIIKNISYQKSLFTDFNMHVFHSPIHISTFLSSEINSYVMKQLFFDIKILVLGLNPEDYFFTSLMVFLMDLIRWIMEFNCSSYFLIAWISLLAKPSRGTCWKCSSSKDTEKNRTFKYKWKMVCALEKINTFLKLKFLFLTTGSRHYISYLRVQNSEILELLKCMQ